MSAEKRKTICQFVHSLDLGGAEILARNLALDPELSREYRFVFLCLDASDVASAGLMTKEIQDAGFEVECLGRRPGLDWSCFRKIRELVRKYSIDLIHAHQCSPFFYASLARFWGKGPAIILTEHGRFYPDVVSFKRRLANSWLLGSRDCLTAVGQAVADALVKKEGFPRNRILTVYNGVNLDRFQLSYDDRLRWRKEVRAEWGLADDDFAAIQVARLDKIKDHLTALKTMVLTRQRIPNARLIIVGDGPERENIERMRKELGLEDVVVLTGPRLDVYRQLAGADVFLLTSLSEGIPVTFLEAMAASLPIVCTNAGGCREVTIDGTTGFVVPVRDSEMLADSLVSLANDKRLCDKMGANGLHRVQTVFDEKTMHETYRSLYRKALNDD